MENIVKRERSTNFNKSEVRLLTDLVAKHRTIIENKKSDAVTNKEKEAAWNKISSLFNAATGFTARTTKSLKLKYESIKKETKKTMAKHRQELYRTGGGPSSGPDVSDIEEKVMAICSNITGLDARNDSDSIPELKPNETAKVIPEALPLQTLENNIIVVSCDNIPVLGEDFGSKHVIKDNITDETVNEEYAFDVHQTVQVQDMEVQQTQKENNWSSWNPKALKSKISPGLKPVTKAGVTAKLDQLTKARLELVEMQKEIARKEHDFVAEEHNLKMLHLQNDEKRKQEIHEALLRQLSTRVQTNILDINK